MSKPATVLLGGLALTGFAVLGVSAPTGTAAYGQDRGFQLAGEQLPTVEVQADDDPDELRGQLGDLTSADPGRYRLALPASSDRAQLASVGKKPGTSLWVSLTTRMPANEDYSDEISITVGTDSGVTCAETDVSLSNDDASYPGPVPIGVLVDPSTVESSSDRPACMAADTLFVQVSHDPDEDVELPAELTMIEEPMVTGTEQLPQEAESEDFEPSWSPGKKASKAHGERSFPAAPALRPGRYTDAVSTGDARLYRVDADWGQHVQATLRLSPLSTGEAAQIDDEGLDVNVVVFGPNRLPVAGSQETVSAESEVLLGARTPPVRYQNRESSDTATGAGALAGPYYVLVTAPTSAQIPDLSVSYELDLRVQGDKAGAPQYTGAGAPPKGALITDRNAAGGADQPEESAQDSSDEQRAGGPAGWWPILGPVLSGLLAAMVVLGIGWLLRLRQPPVGRR